MKSILLNLNDKTKDLLKEVAVKEEMTVSALLRMIIKKYLRRMGLDV